MRKGKCQKCQCAFFFMFFFYSVELTDKGMAKFDEIGFAILPDNSARKMLNISLNISLIDLT